MLTNCRHRERETREKEKVEGKRSKHHNTMSIIFQAHLLVDVPKVGADITHQPLLTSRARIPVLVTQVLTSAQTKGVAWSDDIRGNRLNHLL